jgi:glycosyltransferase involved in cell wall biosynthesis
LIGKWTDTIELKDVPNQEDLVASLRSCDVLILALADQHNTILNDDFRTQFPTRTLEMLISERPVLVVAPYDYYIARFFRHNGAGKVLSDVSRESIRKAIEGLCKNERERNICVKNALKVAQEYRIENVARILRSELLVS